MKKLSITILIIIILIGGYLIFSNKSEFSKKENTLVQQESEKYLRANYTNIDTVEFEELYRTPMGGIQMDGTVNGKHRFSFNINEDLTLDSTIVTSGSFPKEKEECKEKNCE